MIDTLPDHPDFDFTCHPGSVGEVVRTPFGLRVIVERFGIWAAYEREPRADALALAA